ncbi:hypothetical protein BIFDEN_01254 [Bifidobacterium dentium ATCC 27678]|nr:hypothetical protein BIFDEN_01254 [Bifidobacterium dentium ATCC 27678]
MIPPNVTITGSRGHPSSWTSRHAILHPPYFSGKRQSGQRLSEGTS